MRQRQQLRWAFCCRSCPALQLSLYKVFTCCAAVAAAYGVPGLRNFVQLCVWYLLLNLLLCGAVLLPGVQSANLCVYLPLSPGRLLLCCGAVLAVLRGVLFCFLAVQAPAALPLCWSWKVQPLSVQAFCDTGFSVQDPLTGQAVVLVDYPAVRSAPAGAAHISGPLFRLRHGTAAGAAVRLVPCTTIAGHCVLPAVPVKALRTSKGSAAGHSGRILPPGNAAAMDSSAGQRTGRTAGHPLRSV